MLFMNRKSALDVYNKLVSLSGESGAVAQFTAGCVIVYLWGEVDSLYGVEWILS